MLAVEVPRLKHPAQPGLKATDTEAPARLSGLSGSRDDPQRRRTPRADCNEWQKIAHLKHRLISEAGHCRRTMGSCNLDFQRREASHHGGRTTSLTPLTREEYLSLAREWDYRQGEDDCPYARRDKDQRDRSKSAFVLVAAFTECS
jgi:hypothetical protein